MSATDPARKILRHHLRSPHAATATQTRSASQVPPQTSSGRRATREPEASVNRDVRETVLWTIGATHGCGLRVAPSPSLGPEVHSHTPSFAPNSWPACLVSTTIDKGLGLRMQFFKASAFGHKLHYTSYIFHRRRRFHLEFDLTNSEMNLANGLESKTRSTSISPSFYSVEHIATRSVEKRVQKARAITAVAGTRSDTCTTCKIWTSASKGIECKIDIANSLPFPLVMLATEDKLEGSFTHNRVYGQQKGKFLLPLSSTRQKDFWTNFESVCVCVHQGQRRTTDIMYTVTRTGKDKCSRRRGGSITRITFQPPLRANPLSSSRMVSPLPPTDPKFYVGSGLAQDAIDILDHENIDKVIAVGHDCCSRVISRIANYHPHRLAACTFFGVGYGPPNSMYADPIALSVKINGWI
ncbi:hypothetical protein B0H13DRAFT_1924998 [Mycena leptocephala]|nr:hypothetical protein B0H13DRAFT_1924998 [Mycena leptocephala]